MLFCFAVSRILLTPYLPDQKAGGYRQSPPSTSLVKVTKDLHPLAHCGYYYKQPPSPCSQAKYCREGKGRKEKEIANWLIVRKKGGGSIEKSWPELQSSFSFLSPVRMISAVPTLPHPIPPTVIQLLSLKEGEELWLLFAEVLVWCFSVGIPSINTALLTGKVGDLMKA